MKQIFKRKYLVIHRDVDYDIGLKVSVWPYLRLFISLPTLEIRMGVSTKEVWLWVSSYLPKRGKSGKRKSYPIKK